MNETPTVSVAVVGGPSVSVPWMPGMNAQTALQLASIQLGQTLTFALQYFGPQLGYLVVMINDTFESMISAAAPFFYWEFIVNGTPASAGIDGTTLSAGDAVSFEFQQYPPLHSHSTLHAKHALRRAASVGVRDGSGAAQQPVT